MCLKKWKLFSAQTGEGEDGKAAGCQRSLDITDGVADEVGAPQVNAQFASRLQQKARTRFAAIAAIIGMVGTVEHGINATTPPVQGCGGAEVLGEIMDCLA